MQFIAILALAFAPGLFWLWLIYRKARYRPEPQALVIRTFLWGMGVSIPISILEFILLYLFSIDTTQTSQLSLGAIAYLSFIVAGLTEELGKYLVVKKTVYASPYFDEPIDGIVYSSSSALGFASLENLGYILSYGWGVILIRGPISTLAHVLFSALWGYPLGLIKFRRPNRQSILWLGLLGSMIAHGLFNLLIFTGSAYTLLVIPLFVGAGILFLAMLRHAHKISPYKDKSAELLLTCPNCGDKIAYYANFCTSCGIRLIEAKEKGRAFCSRCGASLNLHVNFCTSCGSRIERKDTA